MSIVGGLGGASKRYPAAPQKAVHRDRIDPSGECSVADVAAVLGEQVDEVAPLEGREPLFAENS